MGIGKVNSATYALDISGSARILNSLDISNNLDVSGTSRLQGSVGIGKVSNASYALDVSGTVRIGDLSGVVITRNTTVINPGSVSIVTNTNAGLGLGVNNAAQFVINRTMDPSGGSSFGPVTDASSNLGGPSYSWNNLYVNNVRSPGNMLIDASGDSSGTITLGAIQGLKITPKFGSGPILTPSTGSQLLFSADASAHAIYLNTNNLGPQNGNMSLGQGGIYTWQNLFVSKINPTATTSNVLTGASVISNVGGVANNNLSIVNDTANGGVILQPSIGYMTIQTPSSKDIILQSGTTANEIVFTTRTAPPTFYPGTTNAIDLGIATNNVWNNLYVKNIQTSNVVTSNVAIKTINATITQDLAVYGGGANAGILLRGGGTGNTGDITMTGTATSTLNIGANQSSYRNIVLTPGLITTYVPLIPGISGGYDLGSSTNWWNKLYISKVNPLYYTVTSNVTVGSGDYTLVTPTGLTKGMYSVYVKTYSNAYDLTGIFYYDGSLWHSAVFRNGATNTALYANNSGVLIFNNSVGGSLAYINYTYTFLAGYDGPATTFTG